MAKTIGIYGTGKVGKRAVNRFLPAHLGDEKGRVIFLVDDSWGEYLDLVLNWAIEDADPLCVVPEGDEFIEDLKEDSIPYQETDDPYNTFMDLLEAEEGDLVLLWDDSSEEAEEALTSIAMDAKASGIAVFDLAHGMRELELDDEVASEVENEANEADEEAQAAVEEAEELDGYEAFLDAIDDADSPEGIKELFLDKANRDHLVQLATALNLDFNPSSWQKKIAPIVLDALLDDEGPFVADNLSIRETLAATSAGGGASEAEEPEDAEAEEEPDPDNEGQYAEAAIAAESAPTEDPQDEEQEVGSRLAPPSYATDEGFWRWEGVVQALSGVAATQGVTAAREFYTLLEEKGLV